MEIKDFLQKGKNIVIELDDDVEYILDSTAVEEIEKGSVLIPLIRIYDYKSFLISAEKIFTSLQTKGTVDYIDVARFFIGCIARQEDLETSDFFAVINRIKSLGFFVESISQTIDGWVAPEPYERETGKNLNTKLIVFFDLLPRQQIVRLKHGCEKIEMETAISGDRKFNLNPGFVDQSGMYLASHKSSPLRISLEDIWLEKQMDVKDNELICMPNLFTEYLHPERMSVLNALFASL